VSKGILSGLAGGLVMLALLIAGCGGGDSASALSRGQFVREANAICREQAEKRNATVQAAIVGHDPKKLLPLSKREEIVRKAIGLYAQVPKKLKQLGSPEGDEEKVEAITKAMEKSAAEVKKTPKKALEGVDQFAEANELSREYGLEECVV